MKHISHYTPAAVKMIRGDSRRESDDVSTANKEALPPAVAVATDSLFSGLTLLDRTRDTASDSLSPRCEQK